MKTATPLTIAKAKLGRIKRLAAAAPESRADEAALRGELACLAPAELAEIYALFTLGRAGHRSFNIALDNAIRQDLQRVPSMLADNRTFAKCLTAGLKRYARQS